MSAILSQLNLATCLRLVPILKFFKTFMNLLPDVKMPVVGIPKSDVRRFSPVGLVAITLFKFAAFGENSRPVDLAKVTANTPSGKDYL
jgi:hypothetical protein